jgi:hypothetical protein
MVSEPKWLLTAIIFIISKLIPFSTQSRKRESCEFSTKKQNSSYQNYFVQMDFALSPNWHLETGLALNTTQYALEDLFGTGAAPKLYSFGTILSPRAGFLQLY